MTDPRFLHPGLEAELARQLSPVAAPESLWLRIHEQRRPLRVRQRPWTMWSIAAASVLMLLAGLAWRLGAARGPRADLEALAGRELRDMAQGTEKLDIRTDDRAEIQDWMRDKLGTDIAFADGSEAGAGAVELCGARLIRSGRFSAAVVTYRVGNKPAAMVVAARAGAEGMSHASFRTRSDEGLVLYSWSHGTSDYALAFAGTAQPRRPCLLCHAGPSALLVLK